MTALSFSVFLDKIIAGTKPNTIRQERKHPIKKGDALQLYWNQRSSSGFKIGDAICKEVTPIIIYPIAIRMLDLIFIIPESLNQFAKLDGFENWEEMKLFFSRNYELPFEGVFIEWQNLELSTKAKLRMATQNET